MAAMPMWLLSPSYEHACHVLHMAICRAESIKCTGSPDIPNGEFTCGADSSVGTVCDEVTCAPGFQGTPSATCKPDGTWCVDGGCERIGE
jgi:hypothetical protein